jgi:hypothetical protein
MIQIRDYKPYFIKNSFNLMNIKPHKKIKKIVKQDDLFHIFFHKINNLDETNITINNYNEQQEKMNIATCIDKIKMKPKIKDYIINNLMFDKHINLIVLNAICIHYKINLYYIKDNVYVNMCNSPDENIMVMNSNNMFLLFNKNMFDNLYEITNLEKPLYASSYYKLNELITIASKIQLPYEKIKKQDLYDSIHNYLVKLNIFKID